MRIGFDCDGVLYDWFVGVRQWLVQTGRLTKDAAFEGSTEFWSDMGYATIDQFFVEIVKPGAEAGVIGRHGDPYPGAVEAWNRLRSAGHETYLLTARGTHEAVREVEIEATHWWTDRHGLHCNDIVFSADKGRSAVELDLDVVVEDQLDQRAKITAAGVETWLVTRPWNERFDTPLRVPGLIAFADAVEAGRVGHQTVRASAR